MGFSLETEALMLVVRRKAGESIVMGGEINVSILAVEGDRVKIGVTAPPDVAIVRAELLTRGSPVHGEPLLQDPCSTARS
jgi:carbon storage regulator